MIELNIEARMIKQEYIWTYHVWQQSFFQPHDMMS